MLQSLTRWKRDRIGNFAPTRNTVFVWSLLAALLAVSVLLFQISALGFNWAIAWVCLGEVVPLWCLAFVYTYLRRDARIATLAHGLSVALAFTAIAEVLSYLTVSWQRPLIDDVLARADDALGLGWEAPFHWLVAHPVFYNIAFYAYCSHIAQYALLIAILNFLGRMERCWEMLWLIIMTCCVCLVFSALWPAMGAFGHYNAHADSSYLKAFLSLHNGQMRVIGDDDMRGIIQFPSFHAAMACIFMYVARGIRFLAPLVLILNITLLTATPAIGGHYYVDVFAGIAVAALMIALLRKYGARLSLAVTAPA